MPLFFEQTINEHTKLGIWKIEEPEKFFLKAGSLQRSITHPHKRLQHLAGRFLLSYLFPQFPLSLIQIKNTKKPFLENDAFHFSISHCGNFAAAVVSTKEKVGIDIEIKTPKIEKIAHKFLHFSEAKWIDQQLTNNENNYTKIDLLTIVWCAKEALFKWWGEGGVDFSEMMRLSESKVEIEGTIDGQVLKNDFKQNLDMHYKQFPELTLCWLQTK